MEEKKRDLKVAFGRVTLLLVMSGLMFWVYQQYMLNYTNMELSFQMTQAVLDNQTALTRHYIKRMDVLELNLKQTQQLLVQAEKENTKLRDQMAFLGNSSDFESSISSLKEENARIVNELSLLKAQVQNEAQYVSTLDDGRTLLSRYRDRIQDVKLRIHELKQKAQAERIAAQKENDRIALLNGNQGYMLRDGSFPQPAGSKDIKVNVTFVK